MEEKEDRSREGDYVDLAADFKSYQDRVTALLVKQTKQVSALSTQDLSFHRSSSENVSRSLDRQTAHLLRLTNKLLRAATADSGVKGPQLKDRDGIDDNWPGVVDVIDDLLEKADASLDEFTGAIKRLSPSVPDRTQTPPRPLNTSGARYSSHQIEKPQLLFNRKVNNFDTTPWFPLLTNKPHATAPLEEILRDHNSKYILLRRERRSTNIGHRIHPYQKEIEDYQYPPAVYQEAEPIPFSPPQNAPATFVDTEVGVLQMLQELKSAKEIAVDLEHHDYHTYTGIVCLMQISTRNKDWIVDTLKPWRENLQVLNEVFTDPSILKVFHGSASDMVWLQRDLGLYIVGLFDTYYAADALNFPGKSLKFLLQEFANFEAQKQYQLSDWRRRPLSQPLIDYARSDTHYLLHIYDHVRNLLVQNSTPDNNLVDYVLSGSKKEALQTYERFVYNADSGRGSHGWFGMAVDRQCNFTPQQFAVFRALHQWRDTRARELDESVVWVMPNRALWSISEIMPTNMTSLYSSIRPVPEYLHSEQISKELFQLIRDTKEASKDDPPMHETITHNEAKYGARPQNRWRKTPKEDPNKNQLTGIGATLKQLREDGDLNSAAPSPAQVTDSNVADIEPTTARIKQSGFWGAVPNFSPAMDFSSTVALIAMQAVRPLPPLPAEPFSASNDVPSPPASLPIDESSTTASQAPATNEIFTLRERTQASRKRKAEDSLQIEDDGPHTDDSPSTLTTPLSYKPGQGSAAVSAERRSSKELRKAEKQVRKMAKLEEQEQKARDMVPFDYDAADSMLEPKNVANGAAVPGKTRPKAMNPFAKAMDAGTGARRNKLGQEGAGRSMTFKS